MKWANNHMRDFHVILHFQQALHRRQNDTRFGVSDLNLACSESFDFRKQLFQ